MLIDDCAHSKEEDFNQYAFCEETDCLVVSLLAIPIDEKAVHCASHGDVHLCNMQPERD